MELSFVRRVRFNRGPRLAFPDLLTRVQNNIGQSYDVQRELGVGGTAVVFLAHDRKHGRPVALKVLRPQIAATLGAERFLREIGLAARLTHPLILPLLDSGEVDGLPYFVMPYVQGESLTQRLQEHGALEIQDALSLARDVADALDYAHAVGIVHRDIKPDNILLLAGHAIVADFGIARAMYSATDDSQFTSPGMAVGTPTYMSPEQAVGETGVDGRSDLYSLAAVLYEMLGGVPPFTGPNAVAVIAKRFTEQPRALRELRPEVPEHVEQIVARTLAMDPALRPSTAAEFIRGLAASRSEPTPSAIRITMLPGLATAPVTAFDVTPHDHTSIAVIPFVSLSDDPANEYLCDGVTEEVIDTLSRLRSVRVVARASSFAFKNTKEDARTIGARLGVANVLEGSVRRTGEQLRINARLIQVSTGFQLWSERFDRQALDLVQVQDEIGRAIAETLEVALMGDITRPVHVESPSTAAAQNDFLEGRFHLNKRTEESLRRAATLFRQTIDQDAGYAPGHAALAEANVLLGIYGVAAPSEVMRRARRAATRALELDPTLAGAHVSLGVVSAVFDWDWPGAAQSFQRAIAINPRHPTARQWYAMNYLAPQRQFAEAMRQVERAQALDPLSLAIRASAGALHHLAGNVVEAASIGQHVVDTDNGFALGHYFLGASYRDMGALDRAIASFDRALELAGPSPEILAASAVAHLLRGDAEAATRLTGQLESMSEQRYVAPSLFAQIAAARGDADDAMLWLGKAAAARDPDLVFLALRPAYGPLRTDVRFEPLRLRIGLA